MASRFEGSTRGTAAGTLDVEERLLNPYGGLHGGAFYALADTVDR